MEEKKVLPKKYQMGFEHWDTQHVEIIDILTQGQFALKDKSMNREVAAREVIERMRSYSRIHFSYEEKKMELIEYTHITEHKNEHIKYIAEIEKFNRSLRTYSDEKFKEMIKYLQDWFLNHILITDKKFADFIKKKKADVKFNPIDLKKLSKLDM